MKRGPVGDAFAALSLKLVDVFIVEDINIRGQAQISDTKLGEANMSTIVEAGYNGTKYNGYLFITEVFYKFTRINFLTLPIKYNGSLYITELFHRFATAVITSFYCSGWPA